MKFEIKFEVGGIYNISIRNKFIIAQLVYISEVTPIPEYNFYSINDNSELINFSLLVSDMHVLDIKRI